MNHLIDVLFDELLKMLVAVNRLLDGANVIARHITGNVFTVFAALMVVIRTVGTFADDAKFATFQTWDLSRLLQKRLGRRF